MAKSKSFFGLRRGSTKSHTYQVLNGQQITKDRVSSVRNPQTPRQNAQRIVFATVAQAIKFMGPIINHSFEGVPYGGRSLNRFAKLNLDRLRAYSALDYQGSASYADARCFMTTKSVSALIPNRYIMAQGSLLLDPASANYVNEGDVYAFKPATINITASLTLGDLLKKFFGFTSPSQQLTKCFILCRSGQGYNIFEWGGVPTVPGTVIPSFKFLAVRLVLKDSVNMGLDISTMTEEQIISAVQNAFDVEKSDPTLLGDLEDYIVKDASTIKLNGTSSISSLFASDYFAAAECTILSEFYNGGWLRSNSEMSLVAVPDPDKNYGLTWYEANQAWAAAPSQNADAERYLNEGGEINQIGF